MNYRIKLIVIAGSLMLLIVTIYCVGFYNGYQDRSLISSDFQLRLHEDIYHELEHNRTDLARKRIKLLIYVDNNIIRDMNEAPFHEFINEFKASYVAKDRSEELQDADRILKGY